MSRIYMPYALLVARYRTSSIRPTCIGRVVYFIQKAGSLVLVFYHALTVRHSTLAEFEPCSCKCRSMFQILTFENCYDVVLCRIFYPLSQAYQGTSLSSLKTQTFLDLA